MYHERQALSLCLKHTLNNMLQKPHFSKQDLDRIAQELAPGRFPLVNPHRRPLYGDYDVVARWHDERDTEFEDVRPEQCWGLILNVKSSWRLLPLTSGRHWCGIKKIDGDWWVLDSMLPFPQQLTEGLDQASEARAVRQHLQQQLADDPTMHLFVVTQDTLTNS